MVANEFWKKVQTNMDTNEIDFKTEDDIHEQTNIQHKEELEKEKEKKEKLLAIVKIAEDKLKLKILEISDSQLSIDKNNLIDDMEKTMILHSHIIDDIFNLQGCLDDIKIVQNSLVCLLHHSLKFKNKFKLKGNKELDTYMASDYYYNKISISVSRLVSLIAKSNNFSGLIKQKIAFIRDIQKDYTARLYSKGNES
jgi:hypothetical protein